MKKLNDLIGKIIFNTIRPVATLTPQNYDALWEGIEEQVSQAYKFGYADGLNAISESPYKCGECGGDNLCFDSNTQWDRTTRQWAVTWKETSEAHCWDCGQQVEVFQKLFGDYND